MSGTAAEIEKSASREMDARKEAFSTKLATMRAGRATPRLVETIKVDYYGSQTPMNQLANISIPEPRQILIHPYDENALEDIEKAIHQSDLGLTPNNEGDKIRLTVPQLTEERREELVKKIRSMAEEARVAIRRVRRDANDELQGLEDDGTLSEDDYRRALDRVQDLTDSAIAEIDDRLENKESDIMEV